MEAFKNRIGNETIVFAKTFEDEARLQIKKLADYEPYINAKIRIMPDAHAGKGCTVGTTMTIEDKLTPNLVGVDIGCGMLTHKLMSNKIDLRLLDEVVNNYVPSGFNTHDTAQIDFDFSELRCRKFVGVERAKLSIGSLGGGNHFIEIAKDSENDLYLIIHTGSRKLGSDVCNYYQNIAQKKLFNQKSTEVIKRLKSEKKESEIQKTIKSIDPTDKDLAHLIGEDFDDYMNDMQIVQNFAKINRETISKIIKNMMRIEAIESFETIHNYIDFNRKILRKGAVSAEDGEKLLIPINMRDGSLLCEGKGNSEWNYSAPHGAGRLMSRTKALNSLSMSEFKETMGGIYSTSVLPQTLDEAPGAYKSIEEISSTITETAGIINILKPIYNFKAH